jgi:phosphonate transport system substrate-binding protein
MLSIRLAGVMAGVLLLLSVAPIGADSSRTLVLAIQPTSTPEALAADSKEIEGFLESRLEGVDVVIRVPMLYAGTIEALRFGNADAAFMGAWPASLAARHAKADVVLAEVREVVIGEEKVEKPFYFSYWVVPKESEIRSIEELRGKRVAFPSPLSTSGFVAPMASLVEKKLLSVEGGKVDPRAFFGEVRYAGGYAQAWEALRRGQVDATVIAGDVPEALYREVLGATRVVGEQGPIPSHAVVFRKDLSEPLRSKLKAALLELGAPERSALMRKFVSGIFVGFRETTAEEHLGSLDRFLAETGLEFTEAMR